MHTRSSRCAPPRQRLTEPGPARARPPPEGSRPAMSPARHAAPSPQNVPRLRQGGVNDGQPALPLDIVDRSDSEYTPQLLRGHLERTGPLSHAGGRLGERGGQGGVEADVPLHLLHDLVNVAVEDRDRAEPLEKGERWPAVVRHPAPLGIDRTERHMREHDDGRAAAESLDVLLEPVELLRSEVPQATGLEVQDIDQADEVNAFVVEALPSGARGSPETAEILLTAVREDVVLARNVEGPIDLGPFDPFRDRVEGAGFLGVSDVAGVDDEGGCGVQRFDPGQRLLEGAERILVGFALEADVRVTDLDEAEV